VSFFLYTTADDAAASYFISILKRFFLPGSSCLQQACSRGEWHRLGSNFSVLLVVFIMPWAAQGSHIHLLAHELGLDLTAVKSISRLLQEFCGSERHQVHASAALSDEPAFDHSQSHIRCTLLPVTNADQPVGLLSSSFDQPVLDVTIRLPKLPNGNELRPGEESAAVSAAACATSSSPPQHPEAEDGSDLFDDISTAVEPSATATEEWAKSSAELIFEALAPLYEVGVAGAKKGTKRPREALGAPNTGQDAFSALMGAAKLRRVHEGIDAANKAPAPRASHGVAKVSHWGGFNQSILAGYCHSDNDTVRSFAAQQGVAVVHLDEQCVVIDDKYPKAAMHLLLLPRLLNKTGDEVPRNVSSLTPAHSQLVQHMLSVAQRVAQRRGCTQLLRDASQLPLASTIGCSPRQAYRAGFHSTPSLFPLHMHCISMDMASPHMKNKTHFLSFTTSFMVDAAQVLQSLNQPRGLEDLLSGCPQPSKAPIGDLRTPGLGTAYTRPFSAFMQLLAAEAEAVAHGSDIAASGDSE